MIPETHIKGDSIGSSTAMLRRDRPPAAALAGGAHDFEVYVAAGQVWVSMPDWVDCRAMYPEHARALAYAIERVATRGEDGQVVLAENTFLAIGIEGDDVTLVCADRAGERRSDGIAVSRMTAYGFAQKIREAADRAERSLRRA
ncbi:MAG: hypothetical protein IT534_12055 [Bauldia sp.]|jgi:hypothetical protein|nr:hypothetical protein [Bauldia sp.]